jgi:transcriptional regulator with PAS, ATPase and Fis domain
MLTDALIAEGELDKGMETAAKAQEAIDRIGERIELGALYRAYGLAHEAQGDVDQASWYFDKSIDLLNNLGARYELALTFLACGSSQCYASEVRRYQLTKARALFAEMNVAKRVARIEGMIRELADSTEVAPEQNVRALTVKNISGSNMPRIITQNAAMHKLLAEVMMIRDSDASVLITGETGTGKALLAKHIHCVSKRADKPFRHINCAAIPPELLESELFGHKKGAFTGAVRDKVGLLEYAHGGTFFLNEIGEAHWAVQTKLLTVLDEQTIVRLGDHCSIPIDVRFIAATNADLSARVRSRTFREDLLARLRGFEIVLPPLRQRKDDIPLLVEHFLEVAGFDIAEFQNGDLARLIERLRGYHWPCNIRELKQVVSRLVILSGSDPKKMPALLGEMKLSGSRTEDMDSTKRMLLEVLDRNQGNKSKTARELGMSESTLRYRLNRITD